MAERPLLEQLKKVALQRFREKDIYIETGGHFASYSVNHAGDQAVRDIAQQMGLDYPTIFIKLTMETLLSPPQVEHLDSAVCEDTWEEMLREMSACIIAAELYAMPEVAQENKRRYDQATSLGD